MITKIFNFFKKLFEHPEQHFILLIYIQPFIHLISSILWFFCKLTNQYNLYLHTLSYFTLSYNIYICYYRPWILITYGFFHSSWSNLIFNILFCIKMGKIISFFLHSSRLVIIYLGSLLVAAISFVCISSILPPIYPISAQTGIYGLLGACFALTPDLHITISFFTMRIRTLVHIMTIFCFPYFLTGEWAKLTALACSFCWGYYYIRYFQKNRTERIT